MAKIPSVLIVDQDAEARFQVKRLVRQGNLDLAGESGFGTEAVSLATEVHPDVILCAVDEPMVRALQTMESLINALPQTPLIVYSHSRELDVARRAMRAGARDFLVLPFKPDEARRAILEALESEERRQLRSSGQVRLGPRGTVITVFSPKGGVGKTTAAVNLAVAFARNGSSTVIVDADSGFGDVADMLDLAPERTIMDIVNRLDDVERDNLSRYLLKHYSGLSVLPAPIHTFDWRNVSGDTFRKVVDILTRNFDVVIIDTVASLHETTMAALELASFVLWLTTKEYGSVKDSLSALRELRAMNFPMERIHLALNATTPENDVRPQAIAEALGEEIFWSVPYDRKLRHNSQLGQPVLLADTPASRSFHELARLISGAGPERQSGGLRRLLRRSESDEESAATATLAGEEAS